jgi:cell division protease FtsH
MRKIKHDKNMNIKNQILCDGEFNITQKHESIDNVSKILKSEFIGIDEQIDMIINSIKSWLFFKETLGKPQVINLWGLTGCGKTQVIDRLLELLKLKFISYRVNGSELNAQNPLYFINSHHYKNNHPIVIFDEFQNYRAKKRDGEEIEKYNSIIWDFIDTGMVKYDMYLNDNESIGVMPLIRIFKALYYFSKTAPITYKDGTFILTNEEYNRIKQVCEYDDKSIDYDKQHIINVCGKALVASISDEVMVDIRRCFDEYIDTSNNDIYAKYVMKIDVINYIKTFLKIFNINTEGDFEEYFTKLPLHEITDLLIIIRERLCVSYKKPLIDFSKALIFVVGNLDEAFGVHDDFNPDISANEFYKITKKITIVDIKEALLRRFRSEHIARLGNTHIIYPSLDKKSYEKIIQLNLNNYSKDIKMMYDVDLTYDKSINNIIYKENVYPTLGARSVISGINDMIKSNFANTLLYRDNNNILCDTIKYSYHNKNILAEFYLNGNLIDKTNHHITLRLENLRSIKKDDKQSLVAVHESGHAIMRILLFKKLPVGIYSVTADTESSGFMLSGIEDDVIHNKDFIEKTVMVSLAGRAAEFDVFGWNMLSSGSSVDLEKANGLLFEAYRRFGLSDNGSLLVREFNPTDYLIAKEWEKDDIQDRVDLKLGELYHKALDLLIKENKLLLALSKYLMNHSTISQKMLLKFINEHAVTIKTSDLVKDDGVDYGYRKKLLSYF